MTAGEWWRGEEVRGLIGSYGSQIEAIGTEYGVDPNLMRAIIYEEQTHRWPDPLEARAVERFYGDTVGLGQVTVGFYGYSRQELLDPVTNLRAMAIHISTMDYFPPIDPSRPVASSATRYNWMDRTTISPYGNRVEGYYSRFVTGKWD
jgi:hypothetical protein